MATTISLHPATPTFEDIEAARQRIAPFIHQTPLLQCRTLDSMAGRSLFLKCENLQKVGAFKYRGATNAVQRLDRADAARGVVTHSSGNHAQALALAAACREIPCQIVMPRNAPAVKRAAVEGYGGRIRPCEPTLEARERTAAEIQRETGATFVHPYDNPDVIAGQGTTGLEILDALADVDAVIVPVGGGGLLSGIAMSVKTLRPRVQVFAAEPCGADDAARSFAARLRTPLTSPDTIADGLRTSLGDITWPIIANYVDDVLTVDDEAIIAAMRLCWERTKLVIEPSAAVSLAVALSEEFRRRPGLEKIAVVLTGGNVDLDRLPWTRSE